jgi:hypothetical protein
MANKVNCASRGCTAPVVALIVLRAANKARRGVYALPTCEGHAEAAEVYLWREDVVQAFARENGLCAGEGVEVWREAVAA